MFRAFRNTISAQRVCRENVNFGTGNDNFAPGELRNRRLRVTMLDDDDDAELEMSDAEAPAAKVK